MTTEMQDTYEVVLSKVENKHYSKCETLSGERVLSCNARGENAVIVFECAHTNKPHLRTVVLGRLQLVDGNDQAWKWTLKSENTVALPYQQPSDPEHVSTTTNVREAVPSVTPSVTLSGTQVNALHRLLSEVECQHGVADRLLSCGSLAAALAEMLDS